MKRNKKGNTGKTLLLLFSFFFFVAFCQAQSPLFKNYNVKDGLPSSETYEVFQDSKGFIWIATDRGISRFDGYEFKNFTTDDGLSDNVNFGFYEDRQGRIWLKAYSDKLCYYLNEKFYALNIKDQLPNDLKNKICNSIYVDQTDTLWIGFEAAIAYIKIDLNNKLNHFVPEIVPFKRDGIHFLKKIKGNGLIYGAVDITKMQQEATAVYISENNITVELGKVPPGKFGSEISVPTTRMIKTKKNTFLLSRNYSIYEFNTDSIINFKNIPFNIISLMDDESKGLWLGVKNSGVLYFADRSKLNNPIRFLDRLSVSAVIKDTEGGYWFSTLENGIFHIANIDFVHYTQAEGLSTNKVNCLTVSDENKLWTGLNNGKVNCFEKGKELKEFDCNLVPNAINNIACIQSLDYGWIGVGGNCLSIIKNNQSPFIVRDTINRNLLTKRIFPLKGGLLAAGYNSLREIFFLKNDYRIKIIPVNQRLYGLFKDQAGITWIGTLNGLLKYDGKELKPHLEKSIDFRIDDLKKDSKDHLWAVSKGKGLVIFKNETILFLNKKNGLVSDFCSNIFIDSENTIWAGTNQGISKIKVKSYQPLAYEIENYSAKNGLISNEINQIVVKGDTVYVATNGGVSIFNKKTIRPNSVKPPIYLTKFQVNDSIYALLNDYQLKHDQNFIKINFIGLSYKDAGNMEYKYRLTGLDTTWHYSKSTFVNYTTLPYGEYTFEVSAKNNDGYWSAKPANISFIISPPFWHTWWFRILSAATLISGIFLFIRYRIRLVEKRGKEKLELYQKATDMEMRFLSSQMNPHFTFNAMNSIQKFILNKEPLAAQRYLAQYSKLIRRVLENNMKQFVKLEDEVEMLALYLEIEAARFEKKFDFEITLSSELEEKDYEVPPMIIQPYIENAIWHGLSNKEDGTGKITLNFSLEKECIKCVIEDNGIGREKAATIKAKKEHNSVGMLITSQRLQQLHSNENLGIKNTIIDLKDTVGNGIGTRVEVYLPIRKSME